MISKINNITAFKLAAKVVFFSGLLAVFVYGILNIQPPNKKAAIDTSVTYTPDDITTQISKYVTVPEGGISWDLFSKTKRINYKYKDSEGNEQEGVRPEFSENLKKLDGQKVTLQGYMFPLESDENQSTFLFGPFPMSCPYQYHVGPELVMEVNAAEKIPFEWEPITLKGKLELIPRDDEYSVFYRLQEARIIK